MITAWIIKIILMCALAQGAQVDNWGTVDGHHNCRAILGDTSVVLCADGYVTTS